MKKTLVICGPTATGKTDFGLKMAKIFSGEIISADSRQVYTGMDIVTGKDIYRSPTPRLSEIKWRDRFLGYYVLGGVKTWMYDVVNPREPYNVAFWKEGADLVISDLWRRHKLPVVVGGTGLYIKSLLYDMPQLSIPPNMALRKKLDGKNAHRLLVLLEKLDSARAALLNKSDRNNPRRLVRAAEIALGNQGIEGGIKPREMDSLILGLTSPREILYQRIADRVRTRIEEGAQEEVEKLIKAGVDWEFPSMSASGYKAWKGYFEGKISKQEVAGKWEVEEKKYARKQLTWFNKLDRVVWLDITKKGWEKEGEELMRKWYTGGRTNAAQN